MSSFSTVLARNRHCIQHETLHHYEKGSEARELANKCFYNEVIHANTCQFPSSISSCDPGSTSLSSITTNVITEIETQLADNIQCNTNNKNKLYHNAHRYNINHTSYCTGNEFEFDSNNIRFPKDNISGSFSDARKLKLWQQHKKM